jgi:hypothetical protein
MVVQLLLDRESDGSVQLSQVNNSVGIWVITKYIRHSVVGFGRSEEVDSGYAKKAR